MTGKTKRERGGRERRRRTPHHHHRKKKRKKRKKKQIPIWSLRIKIFDFLRLSRRLSTEEDGLERLAAS